MVTGTFINLASFLLGSKLGRAVLYVALGATLVSLVLWRVYLTGRRSVKTEATERELEALKTKIEVDRELRSLAPDARRDRLRKWVRD